MIALRARMVLPVSRPPIENGGLLIDGSRIQAVGPWRELAADAKGPIQDLGETVVLPGLINAHCHLDYTAMAGHIPTPRHFTDWIKAIVAIKSAWSYADFAHSWLTGARMLMQNGVTTVADVEAVPELLPEMWAATPLRVISFREIIHLKEGSTTAAVDRVSNEMAALPGAAGRVGLSPHAPYSTTPATLQRSATLARQRRWLLTTHVAESEDEFEMFLYGQGPLYQWLKGQRNMSDCGTGSPVRHLERCGYLGVNLLAVHVNYLWRGDAALLAKRGVSVVHCPRSHDYFRHLLFPGRELMSAGVNICLGTDSLASVARRRGRKPELDLFDEMRLLANRAPELSPATILKMATVNGAAALHRQGELGSLNAGALADLLVLPFTEGSAGAHEAAIHHSGPVMGSMIGGQWIIPPVGK